MGYTSAKLSKISEFTLDGNSTLTVTYKWGEVEKYENVYAYYCCGNLEFRDVICDEIDFMVVLKDEE